MIAQLLDLVLTPARQLFKLGEMAVDLATGNSNRRLVIARNAATAPAAPPSGQVQATAEAPAQSPNVPDHVVRLSDGTSWYVDANNVRHHIPNGGTYLCLTAWKGKAVTDVSAEQAAALAEGDAASCRVDEAANHVLHEADNTSWYVDANLVRHSIPDGGTFECLVAKGSTVIEVTHDQVEALAAGDPATCTPDLPDVVIRLEDGRSWYVDGNNVRHPIPDGGTFVCLTAWKGKSLVNVLPEQAERLTEGDPAACRVDEAANNVLRQSDGTAWFVDGNLTRHHIPNGGTYNCLVAVHGSPLIDALTRDHIDALASGDNATCSALLVGPDGTSFLVDSTDNRYWVPDGGVFQCLEQRGLRVFRYDNWDTINLFVDDPNQHAHCP